MRFIEDKKAEWDIKKDIVVYEDGEYTLGQKDNRVYLDANGERYFLSCQPYEPCLYITDEKGNMSVVHNAFDPFVVLEYLNGGKTVTSITGFEYNAKDFCRMVKYSAGLGNINIDDAERAFGGKKGFDRQRGENNDKTPKTGNIFAPPDGVSVIKEDPFYDVFEQYPDSVVDICLIKNEASYSGVNSHFNALITAALHIISDEWELHFESIKIKAKPISAEQFLSREKTNGENLNFRTAFLYPPYPVGYNGKDFDRLNNALFPKGTDNLDIYKWSTDWSDYFDDGKEWWGTLCLTVYDKTLDRFAVITASATD